MVFLLELKEGFKKFYNKYDTYLVPAVIPAITTVHPQTAGIPQTTVIAVVTPEMVTTAAAFQTDFQESDLHSVIPMFMYAKKMIHIMEKSSHSRM